MLLLPIVITLIVVGILLWAMNTYIPMDAKINQLINITIIIVVVLWLLSIFGLLDYVRDIHVNRIR